MNFKKFILAGAMAATALGINAQNLPAPDAQSAILAQQSQTRLSELAMEPIPTLAQRAEPVKISQQEKADILAQFAATAPQQAASPILAKATAEAPTLPTSSVQEAAFTNPTQDFPNVAQDFGNALKGIFGGLKNGSVAVKDKLESAAQNHQIPEAIVESGMKFKDGVSDVAGKAQAKATEYSQNPNSLMDDVSSTGAKIGTGFLNGVSRVTEKVAGVAANPNAVADAAVGAVEKTTGFLSSFNLKESLGKMDSFLKEQEAKNKASAEIRKGPSPQ